MQVKAKSMQKEQKIQEMPRLTPDRDEFARFYVMFKKWFEMEELEVSDFVLGRFASRLQDFIEFGLGKGGK